MNGPADHRDAMTSLLDETTFIVGGHAFAVRQSSVDAPRLVVVTVTMDGRFEWTFEEPGWRPLAFGAWLDMPYLWSARELIVLPRTLDEEPQVLRVDEDLLYVFQIDAGWLMVCETSVRRCVGGEETGRVDLADVVEHTRWEGDVLILLDAAGGESRIRVDGPTLEF